MLTIVLCISLLNIFLAGYNLATLVEKKDEGLKIHTSEIAFLFVNIICGFYLQVVAIGMISD